MNRPIEGIDIETFRKQAQLELKEVGGYFADWLEELVQDNKASDDCSDYRPWTLKGRKYLDFYDTFHHVLIWYKLEKISRFRNLGWQVDSKVIDNIKDKFSGLIKHVLKAEDKNNFHDYFRKYDVYPISRYTAIDYKFQNITGAKLNNILDFGSGIGRQAFQWCSQEGVNFFSVDAIESFYLLQNKIYSLLFPERLSEYFYGPQRFRELDFYSDTNKLYHLPTWRMDLLPDKYFDMIICVQVLQEINEETLKYVLKQFKRIVKDNGFLYIRDNEFWQPTHRVRVGRELLKQGWELIFKYSGRGGIDIEGLPRLWVFTSADKKNDFKHLRRIKRVFLPSHPYSYNSWWDYGLPI